MPGVVRALTDPQLSEAGKTGVMLLLLIGMFVGALLSITLLYPRDLPERLIE